MLAIFSPKIVLDEAGGVDHALYLGKVMFYLHL